MKCHLDRTALAELIRDAIQDAQRSGGDGPEKRKRAVDQVAAGLDAIVTWEGPGAQIAEAVDGPVLGIAKAFLGAMVDEAAPRVKRELRERIGSER